MSSASSSSSSPAPVRLYTHALQSIFAFSSVSELGCAMGVSRDWHSAILSMPSLRLTLPARASNNYFQSLEPFRSLLHSQLGRHIADFNRPFTLDAEARTILARGAPRLERLDAELLGPGLMVFPSSHLRSLRVRMGADLSLEDQVQAIDAIGAVGRLEELSMTFRSWAPELRFDALARLDHLTSLSVKVAIGAPLFTLEQTGHFRALRHLRALFLPRIVDLLPELLRPSGGAAVAAVAPAAAPLHSLERFSQPGGEVALVQSNAMLVATNLPQFTALHAHLEADVVDVDFLCALPQLRTLALNLLRNPMQRSAMTRGLAGCGSHLTHLTLNSTPQLSADLCEFLPRMPQLHHLRLLSLRHLGSLAFLATPTLAASLLTLELRHCGAVPVDDMSHVNTLHALQRCLLLHSFAAPLDPRIRRLYTPPSELMPALVEFKCKFLVRWTKNGAAQRHSIRQSTT